jgi:hypothetical protein
MDGGIMKLLALLFALLPSAALADTTTSPGKVSAAAAISTFTTVNIDSGTISGLLTVGGRLGVGTTSPAFKLHVRESGATGTVRIENSNAAGFPAIDFYDNLGAFAAHLGFSNPSSGFFGDSMFLGAVGSKDINFLTSLTRRMIITGAGNVGIGVAAPDQKLQVSGGIHATSATFDGEVTAATFTAVNSAFIVHHTTISPTSISMVLDDTSPDPNNFPGLGNFYLKASDSNSGNSSGGGIRMRGGISEGGNNSGNVEMLGGAQGASGSGGLVKMLGGAGNTSGTGGLINVTAGSVATGGDVDIRGGTGSNGGDVGIRGGGALQRIAFNLAHYMIGDKVGLNTPSPASTLDVSGNVAVGSYAGVTVAPINGMIVSGNTGIGTSSPQTKFDVEGTAQFGTTGKSTFTTEGFLYIPDGSAATPSLAFGNFSSFGLFRAGVNIGVATLGTEVARFTDSGRFGLGTQSPQTKLDVEGTAQFGSTGKTTVTAEGFIQPPAGSASAPSLVIGGADIPGTGLFKAGTAIGFTMVGSERMRLTDAGWLGINTSSPQTKLDVEGTAQFGSTAKSTFTADGRLMVYDGTSVSPSLTFGEPTVGFYRPTVGAAIGFVGLGQERMRFTDSGRLAVGTTLPQTKLDVNGDAQFGSDTTKSTFTTTGRLKIYDGTSALPSLTFNSEVVGFYGTATGNIGFVGLAQEKMVFTDQGRLGIGLGGGTPTTKLDVNGDAMFGTAPDKSTFTATGQLKIFDGTAASPSLTFSDETIGFYKPSGVDAVGFTSLASEKMRFTATGRLGIGTQTPSAKLHVSSGPVIFDGTGTTLNVAEDDLVVDSGRVGINKSGPLEALDVVGNARVTGTVAAGSGTNIVYYCTGSTAGTFDGNLARGNSNAGACAGGTWVATSLRVD